MSWGIARGRRRQAFLSLPTVERGSLVQGRPSSHGSVDGCRTKHCVLGTLGVRVFEDTEVAASGMPAAELVAKDLKETLEGLAAHLFGKDIEVGPYFLHRF